MVLSAKLASTQKGLQAGNERQREHIEEPEPPSSLKPRQQDQKISTELRQTEGVRTCSLPDSERTASPFGACLRGRLTC